MISFDNQGIINHNFKVRNIMGFITMPIVSCQETITPSMVLAMNHLQIRHGTLWLCQSFDNLPKEKYHNEKGINENIMVHEKEFLKATSQDQITPQHL